MLFKMRIGATEAQAMTATAKTLKTVNLNRQTITLIETKVQPLIKRAIANGDSSITFDIAPTADYYPVFEQILTENGYRVIAPVLEDECSGYRGKLPVKITWERG